MKNKMNGGYVADWAKPFNPTVYLGKTKVRWQDHEYAWDGSKYQEFYKNRTPPIIPQSVHVTRGMSK